MRNLLIAGALVLGIAAQSPAETTLPVSAAASLKDALGALKSVYGGIRPDVAITYNFGGSGQPQQQIEYGAPIDVFISAAPKQWRRFSEKICSFPAPAAIC